MVEFEKDIDKVLPYDRRRYIEFRNADSTEKWYGVSFQLPRVSEVEKSSLTEFVETYERLFKNVVSQLDNGSLWIVNHDDKDLEWLPNSDDNLPRLRTLFKQRNISNSFKGALVFTKGDLLEFLEDLISYPYAVLSKEGFLYKNLDFSHGQLQFIIKVSGHLNIDFLCTNKELLRKVVDENSSPSFIIKKYNGASL